MNHKIRLMMKLENNRSKAIKMLRVTVCLSIVLMMGSYSSAQVWSPDLENGQYQNPILYADYSDPDVIRVGSDFYMVASSFNCVPGIPVLHSVDLVNWTIINHIYQKLPFERYNKPAHGEGSWAPAIRYHNGKFYVYFCMPHEGLFMAETDDPAKEWELHQVVNIELWEDPCPFWDEDGQAWLVRSKVCGNELFLHKMSPDGRKLLDNGVSIFKSETQPTIEGPKFLKKDGYYYILAPAGGVPIGWQAVLRSKNIYGPYEEKVVMNTGNTQINGPHQGGIVELENGEWWFMHFQSRDYLGRIVHLQPAIWKEGWPIIGVDNDNDGIGEPVSVMKKPNLPQTSVAIPQTSDEFNSRTLGLQWQWQANPLDAWYSLTDVKGSMRLFAVRNITQKGNFWFVPNLLLQKFPQPSFTSTTSLSFHPKAVGEKAGLVVMGKKWAYIAIENTAEGLEIAQFDGAFQQCEDLTVKNDSVSVQTSNVDFRVEVDQTGTCKFSYSIDGEEFLPIGKPFKAEAGVWIGAKVGIFCINTDLNGEQGWADFDWFRVK